MWESERNERISPHLDPLENLFPIKMDDATSASMGDSEVTAQAALEYGLEGDPSAMDPVELAAYQNRKRAERFGVEYVEPNEESLFSWEERRLMRYRAADGGFVTGFDPFSEEELRKKAERAERFQLKTTEQAVAPTAVAENEAGSSSAMEADSSVPAIKTDRGKFLTTVDQVPTEKIRPEAIHLHGLAYMSTGDIFRYFRDYGAKLVEWINDDTGNAVFADSFTARRALEGLSTPLDPLPPAPVFSEPAAADSESTGGEHGDVTLVADTVDPSQTEQVSESGADQSSGAVSAEATGDTAASGPRERVWRTGVTFTKGQRLIPLVMRVATTDDVRSANDLHKPSRRKWLRPEARLPYSRPSSRGRGRRRQRASLRSATMDLEEETDGRSRATAVFDESIGLGDISELSGHVEIAPEELAKRQARAQRFSAM